MAADSAYIDYLLELLEPLRGASAKRMFGGHGLFYDGLMFGLVVGDTLYLKVDAQTRPAYESRDLPPFTYDKKDGAVAVLSYYRAPEDALEDSEELCRWARDACEVSRRSATPRKKGKPKKKNKKKAPSKKSPHRR